MQFLLYGANGYTGALIARECVQRGLRPVLAGRSAIPVQKLAEELGCEYRIAAIDNIPALSTALEGMPLVLHCAGPYSATSRPMVDACLRAGVHYLDLTGELATFQAIQQRDAEARSADIMLLPGVGFDIVPTDCVATLLHKRLPSANTLRLGILGVGALSHGTMKTIIENMSTGGVVRKHGALVRVPSGWKTQRIDYGSAVAASSTVPLGDVFTAWYSTGIPDIEAYVALPAIARLALRAGRFVEPLLGTTPVQAILKRIVKLLPSGPSASERNSTKSCVWGEVRNTSGHTATALLHTPNVYNLTVLSAIAAVQRVLAGVVRPGFQTPSLALGAEFVTSIEGVSIELRST